MNKTVYNALNQCMLTGLETLIRVSRLPDRRIIRLFRDHVGRYRIVIFKSEAHNVGYSGVIVSPCGEIFYKQTCPDMRGQGTTRQLQAMLTVWDVLWYPSEHQTKAGKSCYKGLHTLSKSVECPTHQPETRF